MSKFWLCTFLSLCIGTAGAWAINQSRYGHREARFGPFTMAADVTPENAMEMLNKDLPEALGRVELPDGSEHNFGAMEVNAKGEHSFVVKNVGEGDLQLKIGASSCKCTIGSLKNKTLGPGEQTDVKLEWEVITNSTAFSQSAQLWTTDPGNVVINLAIGGQVIREMEIVPKDWSFGEVAAGEPIELSGTIYNYMKYDIVPTTQSFTDETMNELAEFEVEPFDPSVEGDEIHKSARQGFRVKVKIKGGLRQGSVSQNFLFGFNQVDENGDVIALESDGIAYAVALTTGRIIGALGMLSSSSISGKTGGGYIYDLGKFKRDDPLIRKTFVVLKGSERENTNLRIGEVIPDGVVKATLGEPKGRGSMTLYPLEIEVIPGEKQISRRGRNKDDYGTVWIESDNPKVTKMRVALKFVIDPR